MSIFYDVTSTSCVMGSVPVPVDLINAVVIAKHYNDMTFTKESGVIHVSRQILRRITLKNESNPQRPQQLGCWEKIMTLMFSLTSKHRAPGLLARHFLCYSCSSTEKMTDSVTAKGGNYSNTGLSINPRGPALRNVTSHCGENQNSRPCETDLV